MDALRGAKVKTAKAPMAPEAAVFAELEPMRFMLEEDLGPLPTGWKAKPRPTIKGGGIIYVNELTGEERNAPPVERTSDLWEPKRLPGGQVKYVNRVTGEERIDRPVEWTAAELRRIVLRQSFDTIDKDKNGFLSKPELGLLLRRVNPSIKPEMINKTFGGMDVNRDGKVSFDEFEQFLSKDSQQELLSLLSEKTSDMGGAVSATFRIWDQDNSGTITKTELATVLKKSYPKLPGNEIDELVDLALQAMDVPDTGTKGDGVISMEEFVKFVFGLPQGCTGTHEPSRHQAASASLPTLVTVAAGLPSAAPADAKATPVIE